MSEASDVESYSTGVGDLGGPGDVSQSDMDNSEELDSHVSSLDNSDEVNDDDDSDYISLNHSGFSGNMKGYFPHQDLVRVKDGLYKLPCWTVNLRELLNCAKFAALYCKPGSRSV